MIQNTRNDKQKLADQCQDLCRKIVRIRDGGRCQVPGCRSAGFDVSHVVSVKCASTRYDLDNQYLSCRDHHKHRKPLLLRATHIQVAGLKMFEELERRSRVFKTWREPDLVDLKAQLSETYRALLSASGKGVRVA